MGQRKISLNIVEIIGLYEKGYSTNDLAKRYFVSPQTIKVRLRSTGYKLRPRGAKGIRRKHYKKRVRSYVDGD